MTGGRVLLRASSGPRIGLGHVMRARAVAEEVRVLGGAPLLVVDDEPSARFLVDAGFEAASAALRPDWTAERASGAWLDGPLDWTVDLRALARARTPTWLVENRTPAREWCGSLVYPSLWHEPDVWDRVHAERVLAGAAWIPLSRAVRGARAPCARDIDLLITFGGSDPLRSTERVLALLARRGSPGLARSPDRPLSVAVSVGPHMAARRAEIERAAGGRVLPPGEPLAPWMARARAAITALGTTLAELAYLGVPALVLANYAADRAALERCARGGPHRVLGIAPELGDDELARALALGLDELRPPAPIPDLGDGAVRLARLLLREEEARRAA